MSTEREFTQDSSANLASAFFTSSGDVHSNSGGAPLFGSYNCQDSSGSALGGADALAAGAGVVQSISGDDSMLLDARQEDNCRIEENARHSEPQVSTETVDVRSDVIELSDEDEDFACPEVDGGVVSKELDGLEETEETSLEDEVAALRTDLQRWQAELTTPSARPPMSAAKREKFFSILLKYNIGIIELEKRLIADGYSVDNVQLASVAGFTGFIKEKDLKDALGNLRTGSLEHVVYKPPPLSQIVILQGHFSTHASCAESLLVFRSHSPKTCVAINLTYPVMQLVLCNFNCIFEYTPGRGPGWKRPSEVIMKAGAALTKEFLYEVKELLDGVPRSVINISPNVMEAMLIDERLVEDLDLDTAVLEDERGMVLYQSPNKEWSVATQNVHSSLFLTCAAKRGSRVKWIRANARLWIHTGAMFGTPPQCNALLTLCTSTQHSPGLARRNWNLFMAEFLEICIMRKGGVKEGHALFDKTVHEWKVKAPAAPMNMKNKTPAQRERYQMVASQIGKPIEDCQRYEIIGRFGSPKTIENIVVRMEGIGKLLLACHGVSDATTLKLKMDEQKLLGHLEEELRSYHRRPEVVKRQGKLEPPRTSEEEKAIMQLITLGISLRLFRVQDAPFELSTMRRALAEADPNQKWERIWERMRELEALRLSLEWSSFQETQDLLWIENGPGFGDKPPWRSLGHGDVRATLEETELEVLSMESDLGGCLDESVDHASTPQESSLDMRAAMRESDTEVLRLLRLESGSGGYERPWSENGLSTRTPISSSQGDGRASPSSNSFDDMRALLEGTKVSAVNIHRGLHRPQGLASSDGANFGGVDVSQFATMQGNQGTVRQADPVLPGVEGPVEKIRAPGRGPRRMASKPVSTQSLPATYISDYPSIVTSSMSSSDSASSSTTPSSTKRAAGTTMYIIETAERKSSCRRGNCAYGGCIEAGVVKFCIKYTNKDGIVNIANFCLAPGCVTQRQFDNMITAYDLDADTGVADAPGVALLPNHTRPAAVTCLEAIRDKKKELDDNTLKLLRGPDYVAPAKRKRALAADGEEKEGKKKKPGVASGGLDGDVKFAALAMEKPQVTGGKGSNKSGGKRERPCKGEASVGRCFSGTSGAQLALPTPSPRLSSQFLLQIKERKARGEKISSDREGSWSPEESALAEFLLVLYKDGLIEGLEPGVGFARFMSEVVQRSAGSIARRFSGRVGRAGSGYSHFPNRCMTEAERLEKQNRLFEVENSFLAKLQR